MLYIKHAYNEAISNILACFKFNLNLFTLTKNISDYVSSPKKWCLQK